jgi:gamma-glutamylcyclotransferase (GGCT)/AIG2-like uncharacterized protein YtfP
MVLIFVYGSLMKNYWNHFYLDNATFISNCKTVKDYSLVLNGKIPFLNRINRIYKIEGELYNISDTDLIDVDIHEGNEFFYFRRKIKVVDNNNEEYIAYTYFNSLGDGITLDNGNYKNYIKPY